MTPAPLTPADDGAATPAGSAATPAAAAATPIAGGTDPDAVARLYAAVRARLADPPLPPLLPHAPGAAPDAPELTTGAPPPGTAVLLRTSGSTSGTGRLVALSAAALVASARATEERLGGPGRWLLALPAHHVAGLQVLVRSALAGHPPVVLDTAAGFTPAALAAAVERCDLRAGERAYTSLVPTQLLRVLDAGGDALAALRRFDAVLVGGAATPPEVVARARAAGAAVVTTYGMTETGGGCVYDGAPLPGVRLATEPGTDRVLVGGPMLTTGYVGAAEQPFVVRDGVRWLRTADRGRLDGGRLTVLGRVDDVIVTGGLKVFPADVERALGDAVPECVVVGVPDEEWGALVTAVVVGGPPLAEVRRLVGERVGRRHAPRALVRVPALPLRGPGKVDRAAAARIAAERLAADVDVERA